MSSAISRELLDNTFARMINNGKESGALNPDVEYALQYGSSTNGVQFAVLVTESGRMSAESSRWPFLGFTKSSAYTVINSMAEAFAMVNYARKYGK